jgi:iron-sulfur cluster assembly protein
MATLTVLRDQDPQGSAVRLPLAEGENLLDSLLQHGVELAHDCGGTLACATCRVIVREGLESLIPASEDEQDILDQACSSGPGSRLACQTIGGDGDLVIEIPPDEALRIAAPLRGTARAIALSGSAARHLAAQLAKRPGAVAVRLAIQPAGCSGYRYRVDHADAIRAQDVVFESNGIRIAVDPASLPHVQGTTLDVVQEGLSRRLRFDNPNATRTCGCGESFGT